MRETYSSKHIHTPMNPEYCCLELRWLTVQSRMNLEVLESWKPRDTLRI